jgi:hypothetical protein
LATKTEINAEQLNNRKFNGENYKQDASRTAAFKTEG